MSVERGGTRSFGAERSRETVRVQTLNLAAAVPDAPIEAREQWFLGFLRKAGELLGERRLPEAEGLILRALTLFPHDLRALKLLALVRVKLGRLGEARDVFDTAARVAPDDPHVRFQLALVALKLGWFDHAIGELEAATRLRPDNPRAWSYLGYAYAKKEMPLQAAAAFRRAGQMDVAAELEGRAARDAAAWREGAQTGLGSIVAVSPLVEPAPAAPAASAAPGAAPAIAPRAASVPRAGEGAAPTVEVAALADFVGDRLVAGADRDRAAAPRAASEVFSLAVEGEVHVRRRVLLGSTGPIAFAYACRRRRGQATSERLGQGEDVFLRGAGQGQLWLAPSSARGGLFALTLEKDVIYVVEDRVVAFDGDLFWESGRLPRDGLPLLQFRGLGRVVLELPRVDIASVRVAMGQPIRVTRDRLLGWVGKVVPQHVPGGDATLPYAHVACEGEGMLLLLKRAQPA